MINKLYLFIRNVIIITLSFIALFVFILSNKDIIPYVAGKYAKNFDVGYSSIEGTIISGIKIYDITYKNILKAQEITIIYNLLALLRPTPKIETIDIKSLHVNINNLPKTQEDDNSTMSIPSFKIVNLALQNADIIYEDKHVYFSSNTKDFVFNDSLHVKNIYVSEGLYKDKTQSINFGFDGEKLSYKDSVEISHLNLDLSYKNDTNQTFKTTVKSSNIQYKETIDAKDLKVDLSTLYGDIKLDGEIIKNNLIVQSDIILDEKIKDEYLSFITAIPRSLHVKIDATEKRVIASTKIDQLSLKDDENLTLKNTNIEFTYDLSNDKFEITTQYDVSYLEFDLGINQLINFNLDMNYNSTLSATIVKTPIALPLHSFDASLSGDRKTIQADINTTNIKLAIHSKDFENFVINTQVDEVPLDFLNFIPEIFQKDIVSFQSKAKMHMTPLSFDGDISAQSLYANIDGNFEINEKNSLFKGAINPINDNKVFEKFSLQNLAPFHFVLYNGVDTHVLNVDAKLVNVSIFNDKSYLEGWGNLSSNTFNISGNIDEKDAKANLNIDASVPFLHALVDELGLKLFENVLFYDAELNVKSSIKIDKTIGISSRIEIPWYAFQPDSQTTYAGVDSFIEFQSLDTKLNIDSYNIEVMDHKIYSNKDSKVEIHKTGNIDIKEFWIYDNLLLKGQLDPLQSKGFVEITSDKFSYDGKEGNITAKTNIKASIDSNGSENIEGSITLLDGIITYMPQDDYSISDEDIIIIQDIVEKKNINRFINLHVTSLRPIKYKVKNIDLSFTPDITLFQEKQNNLEVLGIVTLNEGKVVGAGKSFELLPSEIYFYGENFNPYLNLNVSYTTLDYIKIQIYITNNVDSPVIIFSSNPTMSQDDIMSYILFGGPSSSVFNSSGESTNNKIYISSLLLGSGIKELFNETSFIKIDTLNILNNKEGTLGYEIGSRLSKELRVVYKNDTISSVIVQYSVNKSTRIDVDVQETGQGVSFIYTKDF